MKFPIFNDPILHRDLKKKNKCFVRKIKKIKLKKLNQFKNSIITYKVIYKNKDIYTEKNKWFRKLKLTRNISIKDFFKYSNVFTGHYTKR